MAEPHTCPKCDGLKTVGGAQCPTCDGKGVVWQNEAQEAAVDPSENHMDLTYRE